jgi:hypothetical protein
VQFDDALVSSVVILFRKAGPRPSHRVEFSVGGSVDEPRRRRQVPITALAGSGRWTAFLNGHEGRISSGPRLGDFFTIKRGIATGANRFFILPRSRARDLGLPEPFLRPILPSPRLIPGDVINAASDGYPDLAEQLVLVDCALPENEVKARAPALYAYLRQGEEEGLLRRYLTSRRQPWYLQEQRPPAPFLCTYMGRGAGRTRPFHFLWNKSRAAAANVYLLLYPTGPLKDALAARPELAAEVLRHLCSIDAATMRSGGRVYGGALHKVEPRELANLPAAALADLVGPHAPTRSQLPLFEPRQIARARAR